MNHRPWVSHFWLLALGVFLGIGLLAHADNPLLNDARDDLHQALNPGGDPPSLEDKTKLVKAALDSIDQVPQGGYRGHRKNAITFIKSALDVLAKGDPDNKANEYIRQALEEVRDITD